MTVVGWKVMPWHRTYPAYRLLGVRREYLGFGSYALDIGAWWWAMRLVPRKGWWNRG